MVSFASRVIIIAINIVPCYHYFCYLCYFRKIKVNKQKRCSCLIYKTCHLHITWNPFNFRSDIVQTKENQAGDNMTGSLWLPRIARRTEVFCRLIQRYHRLTMFRWTSDRVPWRHRFAVTNNLLVSVTISCYLTDIMSTKQFHLILPTLCHLANFMSCYQFHVIFPILRHLVIFISAH